MEKDSPSKVNKEEIEDGNDDTIVRVDFNKLLKQYPKFQMTDKAKARMTEFLEDFVLQSLSLMEDHLADAKSDQINARQVLTNKLLMVRSMLRLHLLWEEGKYPCLPHLNTLPHILT